MLNRFLTVLFGFSKARQNCRVSLFCTLILALSLTLAAQNNQPTPTRAATASANQRAIDAATSELAATITGNADISARLTTLDKSDADLKKSDQAQIDTTQMVTKQLDRLKHEVFPALQALAQANQAKMQKHIDAGCPMDGRQVSAAVYNRCHPEAQALNDEIEKINADGDSAVRQIRGYEKLRDSVAATTQDNFAKEKANRAERDTLNARKAQLDATRKRLEATLEGLKKGIDSCARLLAQSSASCEEIKARCGNIQFDGMRADLRPSGYDSPCGVPPAGKPNTGGASPNK